MGRKAMSWWGASSDSSHFQDNPVIPRSRFIARLPVALAASAALSHEPEHLREDLLSAYWLCGMENMSAKLLESFCFCRLRDFNPWYCQWVGKIVATVVSLSGKKCRSLKHKKQETTLLSRCQGLWELLQVYKPTGAWFLSCQGGEALLWGHAAHHSFPAQKQEVNYPST